MKPSLACVEASSLAEIAAELVISVKTASVHVSHILRKLDAARRTDAARIAHRLASPPR